MSHSTPATYLVWSLLSSLLGIFLVYHLWCFDRFRCLRWNQGTQGAFKRVMTYSYLLSVPLLIMYSTGFCIIKYSEGFISYTQQGIIPTPWQAWTHAHRKAILPLYLCLAFAWALEMVTHLEELCFWFFVVNASPKQADWFHSRYFRAWMVGSAVAVLYMPLVTILTRSDPLKCEAFTFLAGSVGSLSLTLWFLPVLYLFQPFLGGLRREGVDMNTIIRLTKFHELNTIRVVFRLLFAIPLIILSIDGIRPHHHINESFFASEFLTMLAGFGVIVSSGMTLVIFFPRSIENELAAQDAGTRSRGLFSSRNHLTFVSQEQELYGTYEPEETPVDSKAPSPSPPYQESMPLPSLLRSPPLPPLPPQERASLPLPPLPLQMSESPSTAIPLTPNRRPPSFDNVTPQVARAPPNIIVDRLNNPATKISRLRPNFRSPIDLDSLSRH